MVSSNSLPNFVKKKCNNCKSLLRTSGQQAAYGFGGILTTHKAFSLGLEDADALQALWMGTGGNDTCLQPPGHQPLGKPAQLTVTQEAVTLDLSGREKARRSQSGSSFCVLFYDKSKLVHMFSLFIAYTFLFYIYIYIYAFINFIKFKNGKL